MEEKASRSPARKVHVHVGGWRVPWLEGKRERSSCETEAVSRLPERSEGRLERKRWERSELEMVVAISRSSVKTMPRRRENISEEKS